MESVQFSHFTNQNPEKQIPASIKLEYFGEIRKIHRVNNYNALVQKIRQVFEDLNNKEEYQFRLSYKDSEQMLITISSDDDFQEALQQVEEGNNLKILIKLDDDNEQVISNIEKESNESNESQIKNDIKMQSQQSQDKEQFVMIKPPQLKDQGIITEETFIKLKSDEEKLNYIIRHELEKYATNALTKIINDKINEVLANQNKEEEEKKDEQEEIKEYDLAVIKEDNKPISVPPGSAFKKTWYLQNKGIITWNSNSIKLKTQEGPEIDIEEIYNSETLPDQEGQLKVQFNAPFKIGLVEYQFAVYPNISEICCKEQISLKLELKEDWMTKEHIQIIQKLLTLGYSYAKIKKNINIIKQGKEMNEIASHFIDLANKQK